MAQNAGRWQNSTSNTCLPSTKSLQNIFRTLSLKNSYKEPLRTSQQTPLYRITNLLDRWMLIYMYMYTSQLRCVSSPEINYIYKWHPFLIHNSHHRYYFRDLFSSLVFTLSPPVCDVSIYPQRVLPIQMLGGRVLSKAMPLTIWTRFH
jgi:hypothetical protein